MKGIFRTFVLICVTISFCGFDKDVLSMQRGGAVSAQTSKSADQQVLKVILPESTTIRLIAGSSYTGKLTAFNSTNLTISANDVSQEVPLTKIKQVEFQGNVWIDNPDGRTRAIPIRSLPVPLEGVPITALKLQSSSNVASLNLTSVLTNMQFKKFFSYSDQIYTVTKILFKQPPNAMKVTVKAVRR